MSEREEKAESLDPGQPLPRKEAGPSIESVDPPSWKSPSGYSNGILAEGPMRLLFVAGQVAWDADQAIVGGGDFAPQFRQALSNVLEVVRQAGGEARHIVRLTIYVTDKHAYMASTRELGATWRALLGRHYPAMALVEVAGLLEQGAQVEIEATACLPAG